MNKYGMITSGLALGLLAACGGGGGAASDLPGTVMDPPVTTTGDSVMRDASGRVSGVSDGVAFTLSVNEFNANGQPSWQTESERVSSFESDDVFALGGFIDGTPISAVTGTVVDAPLGNALWNRYCRRRVPGRSRCRCVPRHTRRINSVHPNKKGALRCRGALCYAGSEMPYFCGIFAFGAVLLLSGSSSRCTEPSKWAPDSIAIVL